MIDRVPPHNMDAEQSVLGSMLLDKNAVMEARNILEQTDFYRAGHGLIYEVICKLDTANIPVDMISVSEELKKCECLDKVGGVAYVASLTNVVPTTLNARHYAEIVKEKSIARKVISTANQMIEKAYECEDIPNIIQEAERGIFDLSISQNQEGLRLVREQAYEVTEDILNRKPENGITGISTGFVMLDTWTTGLQPDQLIIVAARPAMGKTSWAVQLGASAAIKKGKKVALFSLETSRERLIEKILVNQAQLDGQNIRFGKVSDVETKRLMDMAEKLGTSGFMIDDSSQISAGEILSRCRKAKISTGLDLVIVDYIQLIKTNSKGQTRDREIGEITRALKMMSRELKVPVVALSQLSRSVEHTSDKRPSLGHLRESGSIEGDADMVIMLYRPEYYFPDTDKKGITELIIAKQRDGKVGTIEVLFQKEFTRFVDLAREGYR